MDGDFEIGLRTAKVVDKWVSEPGWRGVHYVLPGEATNQNGQVSACSDHQAPGACIRREGSGRGRVSPGVSIPALEAPDVRTATPDPDPDTRPDARRRLAGPLVELHGHVTRPGLAGARDRPTNAFIGMGRGRAVDGRSGFGLELRKSWIRPFRSRGQRGYCSLAQRGREPLTIRSVLASIKVAPGACIRCDGTTRDQGFSGRFRVPGRPIRL